MSRIKKILDYLVIFIVDKILSRIFLLLPLSDTIFFESVPNMSDSTYMVYNEMLKRGLNKKYKMIWWLYSEPCNLIKQHNVYILKANTSRLKKNYYEYTSKCLISCNRYLKKHRRKQKSYYILHGSVFKGVKGNYTAPKGIDYMFTASEYIGVPSVLEQNFSADKAVHLGLPRNDWFSKKTISLEELFGIKAKKIIIWYPTYRQHKMGFSSNDNFAIPILHNKEDAKKINDYLIKNEVIIILKPHFAQDISFIEKYKLSNIINICDEEYERRGINSYQIVNSSDALLTDYSSIYYDYLLANKPIGLVWEDVELFRKNPGFPIDIDYLTQPAIKIYNVDDFISFIDNVCKGMDYQAEERKKICNLVNYSSDGRNTERVTDYIIKDCML